MKLQVIGKTAHLADLQKLTNIIKVSIGTTTTLLLTDQGQVYQFDAQSPPTLVEGLVSISSISQGSAHSLALTE